MIQSIKAESSEEQQEIFKALPVLRPNSCLCIYGYWKDGKCVGAVWLNEQYPHYLNMEYYDSSAGIVRAIAESFKELFKLKSHLTANIVNTNFKSLKMGKQLGFYMLYEKDGMHLVELTKETWRYKNRYPL